MWLNFYADLEKVGTTEFGGVLVGFDPTQTNPINGAGMFGDTDGDTSRDYRLYKDDVEQDLESGQYEIISNDFRLKFRLCTNFLQSSLTSPTTPACCLYDRVVPYGTLTSAFHTLC